MYCGAILLTYAQHEATMIAAQSKLLCSAAGGGGGGSGGAPPNTIRSSCSFFTFIARKITLRLFAVAEFISS